MINPDTIEQVRPYVHQYGYYAVFFGVMLENLGIPVPGETILIIGGALTEVHLLNYPLLIILTVLGAILGDNLGYWIGAKGGRILLQKYGRFLFIREKQLLKVDEFFAKFGDITIFFARFISGVRVFGAIFAGAARMPWKRFLFFNSTGAIVWALTFGTLGYLFAHSIHSLGTYIFWLELFIIILVIAVIVIFWRKKSTHSF